MAQAGQDHNYKKVELAGGSIDPTSGSVIVISDSHALIHEGRVFALSTKIDGIIADAVQDFSLVVPAETYPHISSIRVTVGEGDIDIVAFEGSTITAPGTIIPSVNLNRNSANIAALQVYQSPTVTVDGFLLSTGWVPPSPRGQGNTTGGVANVDVSGEEWVLAPNQNYILRLTNNSDETMSATLRMKFYEI